jgi:hypothetical protein
MGSGSQSEEKEVEGEQFGCSGNQEAGLIVEHFSFRFASDNSSEVVSQSDSINFSDRMLAQGQGKQKSAGHQGSKKWPCVACFGRQRGLSKGLPEEIDWCPSKRGSKQGID